MNQLRSHYDNLKVARDAPPEVIRAAYKALAQRYHPDRNPSDPKAARIMALVNEAYRVLSDPELRRQHDEWMTAASECARQEMGQDFSQESSSRRPDQPTSQQHQDTGAQTIDLEQSYEHFKQTWPMIAGAILVAAIVLLLMALQ